MPKGFNEHDYKHAFDILFGKWDGVSPCDCEDDGVRLYSYTPSPEKLLMKKQAWDNLSSEAKEIILTILYAPKEVLDLLKTPKRKLLTRNSIMRYFKRNWHSPFITELTIKEIQKWLKQL